MYKLIGIIMIVVAGFFLFVAGKAVFTQPKTNKQLKEAPFITDGTVDPANEGKTVIVQVDFTKVGNASDDEFGLSFPCPIVVRMVDRYEKTVNGYEWRAVDQEGDFPNRKYFYGYIQEGSFDIDPSLMISLGAGINLSESDFDPVELKEFLEYYNALKGETYNGIYYITDATLTYLDNVDNSDVGLLDKDAYEAQVGASRVYYKGFSDPNVKTVALIGRQEGNRLVKDERVDSLTAYANVNEKSELIRKNSFGLYIGVAIGTLICLTVLYFGFRILLER